MPRLLGMGPSRTLLQRSSLKLANWIWSNSLPVRQLPFEAEDQGENTAPSKKEQVSFLPSLLTVLFPARVLH